MNLISLHPKPQYPMISHHILKFNVPLNTTLLYQLCLAQVPLSFIGRSGSTDSAFYLYRATNVGLSITPYYVHVQAPKRCGFCTAKSVPFITIFHGSYY